MSPPILHDAATLISGFHQRRDRQHDGYQEQRQNRRADHQRVPERIEMRQQQRGIHLFRANDALDRGRHALMLATNVIAVIARPPQQDHGRESKQYRYYQGQGRYFSDGCRADVHK